MTPEQIELCSKSWLVIALKRETYDIEVLPEIAQEYYRYDKQGFSRTLRIHLRAGETTLDLLLISDANPDFEKFWQKKPGSTIHFKPRDTRSQYQYLDLQVTGDYHYAIEHVELDTERKADES